MHAFVEEDAGDAAGDFRGDSGATAWRYVTAGIEQSGPIAADFLRDGHFDYGLLMHEGEDGGGYDHDQAENRGEDAEGFACASAPALAFADAQRTEVMLWSLRAGGHCRRTTPLLE